MVEPNVNETVMVAPVDEPAVDQQRLADFRGSALRRCLKYRNARAIEIGKRTEVMESLQRDMADKTNLAQEVAKYKEEASQFKEGEAEEVLIEGQSS